MVNFAPDDFAFFKVDLLDALLRRAEIVIRPKIPSRTLRRAMVKRFDLNKRNKFVGSLFITHFWAVMLHDGHRAFGPKRTKFLVYFVNEADDPRKPTPARANRVPRLTKEQFAAGMARNKQLQLANPGGGPFQHMIVVVTPSGKPGRVAASAPTNFFSEGGKEFEREVDDIILQKLNNFVLKNVVSETKKVTFRIGR